MPPKLMYSSKPNATKHPMNQPWLEATKIILVIGASPISKNKIGDGLWHWVYHMIQTHTHIYIYIYSIYLLTLNPNQSQNVDGSNSLHLLLQIKARTLELPSMTFRWTCVVHVYLAHIVSPHQHVQVLQVLYHGPCSTYNLGFTS